MISFKYIVIYYGDVSAEQTTLLTACWEEQVWGDGG